MTFEKAIRRVNDWLYARDWGLIVPERTPRVVPRGSESYFYKPDRIGLDPLDAEWRGMAVRSRAFLYLHELGHLFAEKILTRRERAGLTGLYGDYDQHYRRNMRPDSDRRSFVSSYARVHPADDFAETFAVVLYAKMTRRRLKQFVECRGKNSVCRRKVNAMSCLVRVRMSPYGRSRS
jgi:hypothetical protein